MRLVHANSREKLTVRLYDRQGRTSKAAVRELTHFLRCHATGKRHPLHWRLLQNLYRISRRFDGKTIVVYSGFRARKVASSRTSRHVRGMAIDLQVEGVSNRQLRDYLMASFKPCGVGYYPKGPFIHFDVRQDRSAFWVDYSGKGEPAAYANDPYAVLKQERAGGKAATLALAQERAGASGLLPTVAAAAGAAVPETSTAAALSAPGARTPALPVIQPDIPPLGMIDLPPSRGAAKQPRPPISSYGAGAAQGPFSSAMRPLAGGRISLAP